MQYQVDGEWFEKPEADRRMMINALKQIALESFDKNAREVASDTLGFVVVDVDA